MEESVSLKDPDLNAKLPSYAITRQWQWEASEQTLYGKNDSGETISRNYWENAIKVQEYLERLDNMGILEKALQDPQSFQKLLKKLHVLQTKGLHRDQPYGGQSEDIRLSDNWEENFRSPNFLTRAIIDPIATKEIMEFLQSSDKETLNDQNRHLSDFTTLTRENLTVSTDVYIPPAVQSQLEIDPHNPNFILQTLNEDLQGNLTISTRGSTIVYLYDSGIHQNPPHATGENVARVVFPSTEYIPQYLEIMRKSLQTTMKDNDATRRQHALANGYQAGIRSQAFETVWNSEMMGIVNFFLRKKLGKNPVGHDILDAYAFLSSKNGFETYFDNFVEGFNPKKQ